MTAVTRVLDPADPTDRELWQTWAAGGDGGEVALVAESGGRPLGLVAAAVPVPSEVVVVVLRVADPHVATALLDELADWAAARTGADRVVLTVAEGDRDAAEAARRAGFDLVPGGTGARVGRTGPRALARRLPRGVQVGVHSGQQYPDFDEVRALWSDAAALGYDRVSLFDHLRPPIFGPAGSCLEAMTLLAALAATTPRVRCALLVSPPTWRHPALTAAAAATIDQVSGGRFELGLGVGGGDLAHGQYGLPQPPLAVRYEQLDEVADVVRLLCGGGPADYAGRHYRLAGAHLAPAPRQRRLPLVIGGSGPRRTLPLVARHADTWNCALMPVADYARAAGTLEELCAAAGRPPGAVRRSMTLRAVVRANRAEAERARVDVAADRHGHAPDLPEYVGFGSAQECLDRLGPYVELGVRELQLGLRPPLDRETLERFATDVAPELRRLGAA